MPDGMRVSTVEAAPPARPRGLLRGPRPEDVMREHPHREILLGLAAAAIFLFLFVGWAAVARLDAGVYAHGQIVVSGNRQSVQHRDGGIVRELDVHEGDQVQQGQVLLRLVADELQANARSAADQVIEMEALKARLMAELTNASAIQFPDAFRSMSGEDRQAADTAMKLQQLEFSRRATAMGTERDILGKQAAQATEQITGYHDELAANKRQQTLIGEEIGGLKVLLDRGLVPLTRLRSLQRTQADLQGNEGDYSASVARTQQEIGEKHIRMEDLLTERDADDTKDLRQTEIQLADLEPKLSALREQIERTTVRSPATGKVVGLTIFTVGGVISPGQKLMDVVPQNEPLVISAKVKPTDMDDLRIGQTTEIKVSAFHDRGLPLLKGRISKISADALTEEKTGASYFTIEATVPPSELEVIRQVRGAQSGLKPGLPVEVVVPLRRRTALNYLVEPLHHMLWRSFREQ